MISTMHHHCEHKGCYAKVGQKTYEAAKAKGKPAYCWDHNPEVKERLAKWNTKGATHV